MTFLRAWKRRLDRLAHWWWPFGDRDAGLDCCWWYPW